MSGMFDHSLFTGKKGNLSKWDVSNVEDMSHMFAGSNFNRNISNWNVSNVKRNKEMFSQWFPFAVAFTTAG